MQEQLPMTVPVVRLSNSSGQAQLPQYQSQGAAGLDIEAHLEEPVVIAPGAVALIPSGLRCAIPEGFECQIRSRSGLAARNGIFALNAPGTIDSDFRGEVKVILANFGREPFRIVNGDRIAQMVVARFERIQWIETDTLPETERDHGGFGSTGVTATPA